MLWCNLSELQRANEINASVLKLIHTKTKFEDECIEIATAELEQNRSDLLEYKQEDDLITNVENQVSTIINILQAKIKELDCKAVNDESIKAIQMKARLMINAFEKILNPEINQLNSTVAIIDSSSTDEGDTNPFSLKISAKISRTQSGKQRISDEKEQQLQEVIKQKDAIIQGLYDSIGSLNKKIYEMKKVEENNKANDKLVAKLHEELKVKEELAQKQVKELSIDKKNLKSLLDASNEANSKLSQALKKAEEALMSEDVLKKELMMKEKTIAELNQLLDNSQDSEESQKLKNQASNLLKEVENLNETNRELAKKLNETENLRSLLIKDLQELTNERNRLRNELFAKEDLSNDFMLNVQKIARLQR